MVVVLSHLNLADFLTRLFMNFWNEIKFKHTQMFCYQSHKNGHWCGHFPIFDCLAINYHYLMSLSLKFNFPIFFKNHSPFCWAGKEQWATCSHTSSIEQLPAGPGGPGGPRWLWHVRRHSLILLNSAWLYNFEEEPTIRMKDANFVWFVSQTSYHSSNYYINRELFFQA